MAGRPRLEQTELRGKNDARAESTANARVACGETRNVLKSLQLCSLKDTSYSTQYFRKNKSIKS